MLERAFAGCAWLALLAIPAASLAQDLPGIGSTADSVSVGEPPAWRRISPLADLRTRAEWTRDLPGGRDDLSRLRALLRLGARLHPAPSLELGGALEAAIGTDHNADNVRNNDNETSDAVGLDLAWVRWMADPGWSLSGGRIELPLQLSALVWDEDLRPAGAALEVRLPQRDFDVLRWTAGWFGVRSLADSWVRLGAIQASYGWRDGGPSGADLRLGYLRFDHADALVADGLARGNAVQSGRFVSDFELLDVQASGRFVAARVPFVVLGEWVENLGAAASSHGWRAGFIAGDRAAPGHVELRYAFHRLEQDAVLAAFDSDDWWFHTRFRGHRLALAVAVTERATLGVSSSIEHPDGSSEWTKRYLFDVRLRATP